MKRLGPTPQLKTAPQGFPNNESIVTTIRLGPNAPMAPVLI